MTKGFLFFILVFTAESTLAQNKCVTDQNAFLLKTIENNSKFRDVSIQINNFKKRHVKCSSASAESKALNKKLEQLLQDGIKNAKEIVKQKLRCKPVDLREKLPEVRNQWDSKWCAAHTTADLVSFYSGKNISSISTHLAQNKSVLFNILQSSSSLIRTQELALKTSQKAYGFPPLAFNKASKSGFCTEDELSSSSKENRNWVEQIREIERLEKNYANFKDLRDNNGYLDFSLKKSKREKYEFLRQELCPQRELFSNLFPKSNMNDIIKGFMLSRSENSFEYLAKQQCKSKVFLKEYKMNTFIGFTTHQKVAKADFILNKEEPFSIAFNPKVLRTGKPRIGSKHYSTVVGRRWNNKKNKCEYLLRNSYGTQKRNTHKNYQFDQGHIWIPKEDLMRSTQHLHYMKKTKN